MDNTKKKTNREPQKLLLWSMASAMSFGACTPNEIANPNDTGTLDGGHDAGALDAQLDANITSDAAPDTNPSLDAGADARDSRVAAWTSGVSLAKPQDSLRFGTTMAMASDGTILAVGDATGGFDERGLVSIYRYESGAWGAASFLTRPTSSARFGWSLAISESGSVLAVGDSGNGTGTVAIYRYASGAWSQPVVLATPAGAQSFGHSIALSSDGSTVVVGDPDGGGDLNGAVDVFRYNGQDWNTRVRLTRGQDADGFGSKVAISAQGLAIAVSDLTAGAGQTGSVRVFAQENFEWNDGVDISRPEITNEFGYSLALSRNGTLLLVGDSRVSGQGAVTPYVLSTTWNRMPQLARPDVPRRFGQSIALSGDGNTVLVGDTEAGSDQGGDVFVYSANPATYGEFGLAATLPRATDEAGRGHSVAVPDSGRMAASGNIERNVVRVHSFE